MAEAPMNEFVPKPDDPRPPSEQFEAAVEKLRRQASASVRAAEARLRGEAPPPESRKTNET
jgi:hypothetical protein